MFLFGHLIGGWLVGLAIQGINKVKISRLGWALLFFGTLLPDVDFLFSSILNTNIHRVFTHSLVFVLLSFFIVYLILKSIRQERQALFVSIGVLTHIVLDMFTLPGVLLFWPLGTWFSIYGISNVAIVNALTLQTLMTEWTWLVIDSGFGLIWLIYLYLKGSIKLS